MIKYHMVGNNERIKIRETDTIDYPQSISIYKMSWRSYLILKENSIRFGSHLEDIKYSDIISITEYCPGGLNFEKWIRIEYYKTENIIKNMSFVPSKFLGFFPDSEKFVLILNILKKGFFKSKTD